MTTAPDRGEGIPDTPDLGRTITGLEPQVAASLAYALGFVSGGYFLWKEPYNLFVRFHALQSVFLSVLLALTGLVLGWIPGIGHVLWFLWGFPSVGVLLFGLAQACQGEWHRMPVVGRFVAEQLGIPP